MNQIFMLCMATETIASDAQQLGVTVDDLQGIRVEISAQVNRQPSLCLQLSYQITLPSSVLAKQLDWPRWQQSQVGFSDYLWEETCLECFITGDLVNDTDAINTQQTAPYIEINASPDGRYALYQFERYRNPATLPPIPLYETNGHTRAAVNWTDRTPSPTLSVADKPFHYERSFSLPMTQLPNQRYSIGNAVIEHIHPCVILRFGETVLYFASDHATPPDFHNSDHWPRFKL